MRWIAGWVMMMLMVDAICDDEVEARRSVAFVDSHGVFPSVVRPAQL
jgi:hypothetical protein